MEVVTLKMIGADFKKYYDGSVTLKMIGAD